MTSTIARKGLGALAAATVLATILAGCSGTAAASNPESDGGIELPRVSTVVSYPALPSGLEQGLFDEPFGTDASELSVTYIASGPDGVQALVGGHTDIVIGGYEPAVVLDNDVRVLALTEASPETHTVLVPTGSEIKDVDDLKGKKVGGFWTTLPPFLALYLEHEGKDQDYLDYIQVPNDGGLSALTSGAIDAWYTWDPFFAQAEIQGLAEPIVTGDEFFLNPIVLYTTQTYIDEHPDSLAAFIEGYIASTTWVNENTDAARDYMAEATGMSPEAAEITIDRRNYEVTAPDEVALEWMQHVAELQRDEGLITAVPDLDTVINSSPLEQALKEQEG
ncbi:MAG: ABC transporter substrate-binding protein [Leucobacter sp.]